MGVFWNYIDVDSVLLVVSEKFEALTATLKITSHYSVLFNVAVRSYLTNRKQKVEINKPNATQRVYSQRVDSRAFTVHNVHK